MEVLVVGSGVVGATIAYYLAKGGLEVTLVDQSSPAQGSTGAALGLLYGVLSQKLTGLALDLRLRSLHAYDQLIGELTYEIPYNRQGILKLAYCEAETEAWDQLIQVRAAQGWPLIRLSPPEVSWSGINPTDLVAALYSPRDRQVDPRALTLALGARIRHLGGQIHLGTRVEMLQERPGGWVVHTSEGVIRADWVVVSAGLGSATLTPAVNLTPVLGQALELAWPCPPGQPVITHNDVHLVPLGEQGYWVGATVEFPGEDAFPEPDPAALQKLREQSEKFYPGLSQAPVRRAWWGLRPRPVGEPAPVVRAVGDRLILATGHYRNGVLLAPVTAELVQALVLGDKTPGQLK